MDFYEPQDVKFIQERSNTSGAGALYISIGPVPLGRVWTILFARAMNSVGAGGENQYIWWAVRTAAANTIVITRPIQQIVDSTVGQNFPLVTDGLDLKLYEGQYLYFYRAAATAGSTISIMAALIESEVPLYTYEEPQIRLRARKALSSVRGEISRGRGILSPRGSVPPSEGGGGRGGPREV